MNSKVYEMITERIVSLLKEGVCPWRKPWNVMTALPQNFASGRAYSGINLFILSMTGFETPYFLTFRQVSERGGTVKKGSKGLPVIYWSTFETDETGEDGSAKKKAFLRYYTVFNATQIEGVDFPTPGNRTGETILPQEKAESIVSGWLDRPRIETGYAQAAYLPLLDIVQMPSAGSFDTAAGYYSTLFHELGHATGAEHRLARKLVTAKGLEDYSREELIAEMTSAFLCAHCGIDNSTIGQQAAYLAGWLKALQDDPKMVIHAAAQAQKAANLILGVTPTRIEDTARETLAPALA